MRVYPDIESVDRSILLTGEKIQIITLLGTWYYVYNGKNLYLIEYNLNKENMKMMQKVIPTIEQIISYPTVLNDQYQANFRDTHILMYIMKMVKRGDSKESIQDMYDFLSQHDKTQTIERSPIITNGYSQIPTNEC